MEENRSQKRSTTIILYSADRGSNRNKQNVGNMIIGINLRKHYEITLFAILRILIKLLTIN